MDWKKIGWLNLMLVLVPVAVVLRITGADGLWIFLVSGLAIIPLAGLMGRSTEMLADRFGPGIGGLLNASFGNAAELIIAAVALHKGYIGVVKASITGSILGNVLLVLGLSFLWGGLRFPRQKFNATAAGVSATLLALGAVALLVPAIFHASIVVDRFVAENRGLTFASDPHEQEVSLEISIVLFVVYLLMLLFSLKTHSHLYAGHGRGGDDDASRSRKGGSHPVANGGDSEPDDRAHFSEVEGAWSLKTSVIVLIASTACVGLMSEFLVGAIEHAREALGWSELFVGVIVVAVVGNAAEHSTAVLMARKNHMDLSFQIAVGSGLQIALFVAPILVFMSYLPGFPHRLDLVFSMLEVLAVGVSVMVVGLVALDGESNWLEGLLLLAVYTIFAFAVYHLPEPDHQSQVRINRSPIVFAMRADSSQLRL